MDIKEELQKKVDQVVVEYHDYKSTYLKIERRSPLFLLKLHNIFLNASDDVKKAIVEYCLTKTKESQAIIKSYANECFSNLDNSNHLDKSKLVTKGDHFDLKQIYENLNMVYFDNKLDLSITFFDKPKYYRFCHFTFGNYNRVLKLIKINKMLDQIHFPFYFINYVVYHEMLHSICEEKNINGKRKIHTKDFKEKEKKFAYFIEAKAFEKIFLKKRMIYVRT